MIHFGGDGGEDCAGDHGGEDSAGVGGVHGREGQGGAGAGRGISVLPPERGAAVQRVRGHPGGRDLFAVGGFCLVLGDGVGLYGGRDGSLAGRARGTGDIFVVQWHTRRPPSAGRQHPHPRGAGGSAGI